MKAKDLDIHQYAELLTYDVLKAGILAHLEKRSYAGADFIARPVLKDELGVTHMQGTPWRVFEGAVARTIGELKKHKFVEPTASKKSLRLTAKGAAELRRMRRRR